MIRSLSANGSDDDPMSRGQRWTVIAIILATIILGVVVEWRSVFLRRRMTDLGPYLRAAWAVRVGADLYAVTDNNGWHYVYPPFLAILLTPLADAPPGGQSVLAPPWAVSVAVWYALSVAAIFLAIHLFAAAIEARNPKSEIRNPKSDGFGFRISDFGFPAQRGYAWWSLRLVPLLLVLPAVGRTLARGQVNTIVLVLLAGWAAGLVTGRRLGAGVCLAFAICIKVIPAFLILHPLWRRDGRCLAGLALGLTLGLVVLPVLASGPHAALAQTYAFLDATVRPGLGAGGDNSRAAELTSVTGTDSQAILTVLHNIRFADPWARTDVVAPETRAAHWIISGLLTVLTLTILGRRPATPQNEVAFIGTLMTVMTVITPVNHLHYYVFALPLVMALWSRPRGQVPTKTLGFFLFANFATTLPILALRMYGLITVAALLLWVMALGTNHGGTEDTEVKTPRSDREKVKQLHSSLTSRCFYLCVLCASVVR